MMHRILRWMISSSIILLFVFSVSLSQKVETVDGVRVIHNSKTGKWGKNPKVEIKFVKTIGDIESEDENVLFYIPSDIAFDNQGNIYVLDSGNHRIQKFSADGTYIASIGRKGQGPAEFQYPLSLDVDANGYLYVSDMGNQRIQVLKPEGTDHKTIQMINGSVGPIRVSGTGQMVMGGGGLILSFGAGSMEESKELPKLMKVLDLEGKVEDEYGDPLDFKDFLLNRMGNGYHFAIDTFGNTYVAFDFQNRIEKFSPERTLLWKSNRELNYSTTPPKRKGGIKRSGGMMEIRAPQMNRCSNGVAVDGKSRIWVVTLRRQIKDEESVGTNVQVMRSGGERSMSLSVEGNTDIRETDVYLLEVYSPDGILLGKLPLKHFVDDIRINKDRIFLLDKMRGMQFYEYRILEK